MRMLVFGGTRFLSKAVATAALARGHEVTCAARGESGDAPAGARFVRIDRDADDGLSALRALVACPGAGVPQEAGERFDAVIDTALMSLRWVREALALFSGAVGHYGFVSSINVYADTATPGQTTDAPLVAEVLDDPGPGTPDARPTPEVYGGVKVACENALRASGLPALIVRAGLIIGPGDTEDRFGYWAARMARGGRVLVPDDPATWASLIDVRDLADWLVRAAERRLVGTFDGTGPAVPLAEVLREVADAVAPPGTELVGVGPEALTAAGVQPWAGPRSLPLWLPPTHHGLTRHDPTTTLEAGLRPRPLAETAADALAFEQELGTDRPHMAGLTPAEEDEVLSAYAASA